MNERMSCIRKCLTRRREGLPGDGVALGARALILPH